MTIERAKAVPLVEPAYTWEGFLDAAKRFARSALQHYTPREAAFYYLHAGTAVELGVKAALCRVSPALLVEGQRFSDEALVRLVGFQPAPRRKGSVLATRVALPHTVGFGKAIERFELLYGDQSLGVTRDALEVLKGARDLTAHASAADAQVSQTMHDVLVTLASVFRHLLPLVDQTEEQFWGEYRGTIKKATEENRDVLSAQARGLIAAARERFEKQYEGVEPGGLEAHMSESFWNLDFDDSEWARRCPACGASGVSRLRAEKRVERGKFGRTRTARGYKAIDFRCHICKLVLETEQLVDVASDFESWEEDHTLEFWAEDVGYENLDEDDRRAIGIDPEPS